MVTNLPSPTISPDDVQDDFPAFRMHPVICDIKLSAELFASNGNIVFICGKGNHEKQGMLLVSCEIPSTLPASICLLKVIKLKKKSVAQLETIPIMKTALLLGDGIVSILDIDSLAEIATVSTRNVTIFSTWYDTTSNPSSNTTPVIPITPSTPPISVPNELRICVATKRCSLVFHRWFPQQRRLEEHKDSRGNFDLIDTPHTIALSRDKICIGYKKLYVIMSLTTGKIINELAFNMACDPVINCLQDRAQWCIQMGANTVFLNSNFEPLYESGIIWKDIPSDIVQASPYVLALMNQSIDICIFNGSQSVPIQQISQKGSSTAGKCRLWMDAQTKRIYAATPTDISILEPIPVHIQLQKYTSMYRYDLAIIFIRAVLGMSVSSSKSDSRANDGHAKGNLDRSKMPKEMTLGNSVQSSMNSSFDIPTSRSSSLNNSARYNQPLSQTELWNEYYRIGTMHAFHLFHKQEFEQAFAEFKEFITDPAEIISLFRPLAANKWLTNSYYALNAFVKQHRHFSEPDDFVGVKFENVLHKLLSYLTDICEVFQTIFRRLPDAWLEVQSLAQNRLILKPVRDLLIIVETSLFKIYVLNNNTTVAYTLLGKEDNCCLPSEVEKELKKAHHRKQLLVSFYQKQNRHNDALQLIMNTYSLSSNNTILNYLAKLDNDQLPLIFKYVQPMLKSALEEKNNEDLLYDILILFIGKPTSTSPSTIDALGSRTIKLDPIEVYRFLKDINQDFATLYLENVCSKPEMGAQQLDIHDRLDYAYCDQLKILCNQLKRSTESKQQKRTAYGVGVYFSSNAAYSHGYSRSNANGERNMFLARVLVGNTTKVNGSMKTRPVGFDSTTDGNHIFVTYHDTQVYAEYLITYK